MDIWVCWETDGFGTITGTQPWLILAKDWTEAKNKANALTPYPLITGPVTFNDNGIWRLDPSYS